MGLPQLLPPSQLSAAQASIQSGGDGVREGVAIMLTAFAAYTDSEGTGGVNGSQVIAAAMRRLTEDPYLTLGLEPESDDGAIKKSYRKLALKYHPDKNKATPTLFQAVQGAYDILIEPSKRAAYDVKRKRQQEALSRLRKNPKAAGAPTDNKTAPGATTSAGATPEAGTTSSPGGAKARSPTQAGGGGSRAGASTTGTGGGSSRKSGAASERGTGRESRGAGEPATASGDEKVRQFNKRFYEEFRREAQKQEKSKASKGEAGAMPGTSAHQPPPRPKMRSTNRTGHTVTLEWRCGTLPVTTAYELQWRQRGRAASDWVTSPTLVVGNSCRKKNLEPCTCYEFRVRAASAWGWSGHCDPVMVVTLPSAAGGSECEAGGGGDAASGTPRQKVSGFQSDGIGGSAAAAEKARAQVEEARRRRSQTQGASQQGKASPQFRSSPFTGGGGSEGVGEASS